jgi:hypothetical protein
MNISCTREKFLPIMKSRLICIKSLSLFRSRHKILPHHIPHDLHTFRFPITKYICYYFFNIMLLFFISFSKLSNLVFFDSQLLWRTFFTKWFSLFFPPIFHFLLWFFFYLSDFHFFFSPIFHFCQSNSQYLALFIQIEYNIN